MKTPKTSTHWVRKMTKTDFVKSTTKTFMIVYMVLTAFFWLAYGLGFWVANR